ncbi:MAG TPA: PHP domain-containing protein [Lachnospiraceae bacterium]|nr:PHP domain-containing protein [Lachnospiraceae bacterium]
MQAIDLHVHSNRSDGTFSPSQLVDYAMEKGLKAFALTDHDTVDGLDEAIHYAEKLNAHSRNTAGHACTSAASVHGSADIIPEVIPGIEFSTEYQKQDVHILGLFIDYHEESFQRQLKEFVDSRTGRNRKMCRLLTEAGIPVTYDELLDEFPDAVITRAHYAKYMLNHGYTTSMAEAFERYIGDYCPCYVPREKVTPVQAVELVLKAGGVPILAHPVLYHMSDSRLDTLVRELTEAGLTGLEAIYSTYNASEERQMRRLADKYGLLISGGSDFHGGNKPGLDMGNGYGKLFVPCSLLDDIRNAAKKLRE